MALSIRQLPVPVSVLGEGPLWSEREHCLYFVDIASKRVQAYWPEDGAYESWQFETYTGSLAECKSGGLLVALGDRVVRFDPRKGPSALEDVAVLERDRPLNRLNDGKVDSLGRFWVGSMRVAEDDRAGRLWCVSANGKATEHRDGIGVSNSLAFDRERQRIYFADSMAGLIEQAPLPAGDASPRFAPFARAGKGAPDGSCTDAEGFLWNAEWGGSRLVRYSPDGEVNRVLEVPVSRPSCCTFGGADYRTLYVTSARYNMNDAELAAEPQAGSLYAIELEDVRGLAPDLFAL